MNISDKTLKPSEFVDQNVYKALKERANKYQDLFESAYDVFLCIDKTGLILDINRRAEILTGYSRAELRNMNVFRELVVPEDRKAIRQVVKNAVLNKSRTYEVRWQAKDGKIIQFEGTTTARTSEKGAFISTICVLRDITERKRTEEQLERITRQNQLILNSAGEGIYGLNSEGKTTFANPAAARMVGWEIDELTGKFQHDIIHHSKKDGSPFPDEECQIYAAFRDGNTHHVTDEFFWRKDGTSFPVEYTSTPIWENGELAGSVVVFQDISERKEAEEALRESEERHRSLYNNTPVMLHSVDRNGRLVSVSNYWLETLGYERSEVIGRLSTEFLTEESRRYAEEVCFPAFFNTGRLKDEALQFVKKNGEVIDALLSTITERDAAGEIVRSLAVVIDVTERKRAEEKLRESEERFRLVFEEGPIGMHLVGPSFHFVRVNNAFCEMLGYTDEELVGLPLADVIHPDDAKLGLEFARKMRDGRIANYQIERRYIKKNKEVLWTNLKASVIRDRDGTALYGIGIVENITERRQAEEALRNALSEVEELKNRLQEENIYLQNEIKVEHNFGEIIGLSASLKKALGQVEQVASTDANVLILGETGTGKELIARAVHELSNRKQRPLVKVNCATLPANLIESELFGHERGAFTGALTRKVGRFELADKGTIFLDEIGDLPLELQVKLLRVLQEGEFERLGSHVTHSVDVRVIAATNRDIEKQVQEGTFREDLFFRLNVFPILVPPLRERKEDIPVLAKHFIEKYATKLGKQIDVVPVKVMNLLQGYEWPGNVRELENIIERAMVISVENKLELGDWFLRTISTTPESETQTLQEIEKQHILKVLHSTMWRVSGFGGAAEILGLNPTTLESRMKKLGIRRAK